MPCPKLRFGAQDKYRNHSSLLRGGFSVYALPKATVWRAGQIQKPQQLVAWWFFSLCPAQSYGLARRTNTETTATCCVVVFQFMPCPKLWFGAQDKYRNHSNLLRGGFSVYALQNIVRRRSDEKKNKSSDP